MSTGSPDVSGTVSKRKSRGRSNLALLDKLKNLNAGAAVLTTTIKKNFEEVGV